MRLSEKRDELQFRLARIKAKLADRRSGTVAMATAGRVAEGKVGEGAVGSACGWEEEAEISSNGCGCGAVSGATQESVPGLSEEALFISHNRLGRLYTIKLVYPDFYLGLDLGSQSCWVGFPTAKERLAKQVESGHCFFVYVTAPERRVIGAAQAMGPARYEPQRDYQRPWQVELAWLIGPKTPGLKFQDIGLQVKSRVGDSCYSVTEEVASVIVERLSEMEDLGASELERKQRRYGMFR